MSRRTGDRRGGQIGATDAEPLAAILRAQPACCSSQASLRAVLGYALMGSHQPTLTPTSTRGQRAPPPPYAGCVCAGQHRSCRAAGGGGVPVTPSPVTPSPVTPSPVTPSPVTPSPVTPSPVTPSPVTPSPVTPSPVTPSPVTLPHLSLPHLSFCPHPNKLVEDLNNNEQEMGYQELGL
ncbi:hypothetical protein Pmani_033153 [Petrolisthes manimaculis]|uniref:Uncharacterized protein n=1 Tax=Petrolisthes manimaculis TaxID=1843537 RepID=A0AAE1TT13_9EUCA|nr:hypothetical protein Pmani_033153 [Petrolisthes manimaculis]